MKKINTFLIIFFKFLIIYSCRNNGTLPSEISKNIEGQYIFEYPSGEIEFVVINSDSTYQQFIYMDQESLNFVDSSLYRSHGRWFVSGKKINFNNWLMFNYLRDPDSILVSPYNTTLLDVYWFDNQKKDKPSLLSVFEETGYIFESYD